MSEYPYRGLHCGDTVYERDGRWYWTDETWAEQPDSYATKKEACEAQRRYCHEVLGV